MGVLAETTLSQIKDAQDVGRRASDAGTMCSRMRDSSNFLLAVAHNMYLNRALWDAIEWGAVNSVRLLNKQRRETIRQMDQEFVGETKVTGSIRVRTVSESLGMKIDRLAITVLRICNEQNMGLNTQLRDVLDFEIAEYMNQARDGRLKHIDWMKQ